MMRREETAFSNDDIPLRDEAARGCLSEAADDVPLHESERGGERRGGGRGADEQETPQDIQREQEILYHAAEYIRVLQERHEAAKRRLRALLGDKKAREDFDALFRGETVRKEEKRKVEDTLRRRLYDAVVLRQGRARICSPKEIAPWLMGGGGVRYYEALRFFKKRGGL